MVANLGTKN